MADVTVQTATMTAPVAPRLHFPSGRWRGAWIWAESSSAIPRTQRHTVGFHHPFTLSHVPEVVPARVAAVGRVQWAVNGAPLGRGPVRTNPKRSVWDDADIAGHLRVGTNVVSALVTLDGRATAWSMPLQSTSDLAGGAFVFEAHVDDDTIGPDGWLISDATWTAGTLSGWSASAPKGLHRGDELIDLRSLPSGWETQSTAPPDWPAAIIRRAFVLGASGRASPPSFPVGPLHGRPITVPDTDDIALVQMDQHVFLAERVTVGTMLIEVEGPAGATVTVSASERLGLDGDPQREDYDACATITLDGSRRSVETIDVFGLHAASVTVTPGASVHGVTIRERLHPVTGHHWFRCSDPLLERISSVGRRTVSICSLDSYIDCPTREQRAWTGDSVVHQMADLTTNNDWSLARWHPLMAASPRADSMLPMAVAGDIESNDLSIIPDWGLHWVHSVWNLYRYVGDRDELAPLLTVAEGVLRWFLPFCDEHGVPVDIPGWVIIDWSSVYSDGASSSVAGLWGRALLEFGEMAEWLGDAGRAAWARTTHSRLCDGFERFWDPERERYVDSIVDGQRLTMASQHGQACAIVGGLAPSLRWARLVQVMTDETTLVHAAFSRPDGPSDPGSETELGGRYLLVGHPPPWWDVDHQVVRAQPFFRYVVHDAIASMGRADLLPAMLLDWSVLLERCATSFSESWYGGTTSHGWSSTPTRDVVQRVLGVQPDEPGFGVARIEPHLGYLEWAEGSVPTPWGPITMRVDREALQLHSPVPMRVILDGAETRLDAGTSTITRTAAS